MVGRIPKGVFAQVDEPIMVYQEHIMNKKGHGRTFLS